MESQSVLAPQSSVHAETYEDVEEEEVDEVTHLAERRPKIGKPIRMEAPARMKAPERVEPESREAELRRKRLPTENKSLLANYAMLAASSQRAGNVEGEAQAYFATGIVHDNAQKYAVAARSYEQCLEIAEKSGDRRLQALALNCLGVAEMHCNDKRALQRHEAHLSIASDDGGKFIALTNLGLCQDDVLLAARRHQEALKLALSLGSTSGQSLAVGNLGSLALQRKDFQTAKPCMEQHLALVRTSPVPDKDAEIDALFALGHLADATQDYDTAVTLFSQAADLAKHLNYIGLLKQANCFLGQAKANLALPDFFNDLISQHQLRSPATPSE